MKRMNQILMAAAVAAVLGASSAAQGQSQLVGDDGIAASPKVRKQMNERRPAEVVFVPAYVTPNMTVYQTIPAPGVAVTASPGVARQMADREVLEPSVITAPVRGSADDGIAASPKVRKE